MMRNKFVVIFILLLIVSCKKNQTHAVGAMEKESKRNVTITVEDKIEALNNSTGKDIMVIAHRGDWRNAPENSIQAIKNCIEIGVDIVEIDVRKTKDGELVVIHDETLDRTTTGKGFISEWTLDSLKTLYLKNGLGIPTKHKIPTLEEALLTSKDRILINLDKCYDYFDEAYLILERTNTTRQVIIKGYNKTVEEVQEDFGPRLDSIIFMPIIDLDKEVGPLSVIESFQDQIDPVAFEIVFSKDSSQVIERFNEIQLNGSRVWVNSLWPSLNAGFDDDSAVKDTDSIYGWYLKKHVNMIQTDRPHLLIKYLKEKGKRL